MRFFAIFLALFFVAPLEAGAAAKVRKPANAIAGNPARVITFACRENPEGPELGLGLAFLRIDPRDPNAASVGISLYVQMKKNIFATKTYQGTAAAVPGGYSITMQGADNFTLNLHQNERTVLPGLPGRSLACESTGTVNSNP